MTPTDPNNVHGQTIALDVTGEGSGNVSVIAYNQQGGSVHSAQVNYPVQVCCVPAVNTAVTINSGNAGFQLQAASVINASNDIQSKGSATMHAGHTVHLVSGFHAASGSAVHLYNAPCNSGYYRTAFFDEENEDTAADEDVYQNEATEFVIYTPTQKSDIPPHDKFSIAPNPTTDEVTINVFDKSSPLLLITVYDAMGSKVYETKISDTWRYVMNLSHLNNGVYSVRLGFSDYTANKLLVKQSD